MNIMKNDFNESFSSNLVLLREKKFLEDWELRIDSELWKCPIFVGSFPNLGDSWQKNKYTGLISVERQSFSWMG